MGKVKQLWQDEIDQAVDEYHDEVNPFFLVKEEKSGDKIYLTKQTPELIEKAKKRLISKLHANGCSADHIEEIVNCECR
jgi:hypothetical protein